MFWWTRRAPGAMPSWPSGVPLAPLSPVDRPGDVGAVRRRRRPGSARCCRCRRTPTSFGATCCSRRVASIAAGVLPAAGLRVVGELAGPARAVAEADVREAVAVGRVVDGRVGDGGGLARAGEPPGRGRRVEIADAGVGDPACVRVQQLELRLQVDPLDGGQGRDRRQLRGRRADVHDGAGVVHDRHARHLPRARARPPQGPGRRGTRRRGRSARPAARAAPCARSARWAGASRAGRSRSSGPRPTARDGRAAKALRGPCTWRRGRRRRPSRRPRRSPCSPRRSGRRSPARASTEAARRRASPRCAGRFRPAPAARAGSGSKAPASSRIRFPPLRLEVRQRRRGERRPRRGVRARALRDATRARSGSERRRQQARR